MFCTNCGNPISENDAFCPNCGTPVAASAPVAPEPVVPSPMAAEPFAAVPQPEPAPVPVTAQKRSFKKPLLIGGVSLLGLAALAAVVVLALRLFSPTRKVRRAFEASGNSLRSYVEQLPNLKELCRIDDGFTDEVGSRLTITVEENGETARLTADLGANSQNGVSAGSISSESEGKRFSFRYCSDGGNMTLGNEERAVSLSALQLNELLLETPGELDSVVRPFVLLSSLTNELATANRFDESMEDLLEEAFPEEWAAFDDSVRWTAAASNPFDVEGQVYTLTWDHDAAAKLYSKGMSGFGAMMQGIMSSGAPDSQVILQTIGQDMQKYAATSAAFLIGLMDQIIPEVDVLICDDMVVGVYLRVEITARGSLIGMVVGEDVRCELTGLLTGGAEPWETARLTLRTDGKTGTLELRNRIENGALNLTLTMEEAGNREELLKLRYVDADGELTLEAGGETILGGNEEEDFEWAHMHLTPDGDTVRVLLETGEDFYSLFHTRTNIEMVISPDAGDLSPLNAKTVTPLLTMNSDDLEAFFASLEE